jgi:type I restriction enzyme S subunit
MNDRSARPDGWTSVRLSDHTTVKARLGWKGLKAEEYVQDGYIFLATPNLKANRIDFENVNYISKWRYDESPEIQLRLGDVLIVKDGSTLGISNYVRYLPRPTTVNGSIAVVRTESTLFPEFLYHFVNGDEFQKLIALKKAGLGVPHLFQADLREFAVSLPPLPEQRRIARILTTLDNLIEKTETLIAKYQAIKQGMMHDLFTRGVDAHGNMRPTQAEAPDLFKQSELGWIPMEWEAKLLKTIATVRYGISDPLDRALEEGLNIISLPNVSITGVLILDDVPKVERRKVGPSDFLCEGDLLFNWRNGSREHLGKTAYFDLTGEWTHVGFLLKVAADRVLCDPKFLFYEFIHRRATGFFLTSKAQVNNTFNSSELGSMVIRVPRSLGEQRAIATRLSSLDSQMNGDRTYLRNLAVLKTGLMQDLLIGKVRVKVDEAEEVARHA